MADDDTALDTPGGGDAPEPSLHDDIASAYDAVEGSSPGEPAAPAPGAAPGGDRARGPDGRYASSPDPARPAEKAQGDAGKPAIAPDPKQALGTPQKPAAPAQAPAAGGPAPAPVTRAPVAWKAAAREHWAKLPAEVQQEVSRREAEVGRVMQETSRAREAVTHMQRAIAPFAANIQAGGGDAVGAITNFFQADNTLRHGSIAEKAKLVADVIKNYGVDIQALDSVLAGQAVAPDPNAALADKLRREMAAQLQPVMNYFNTMQGRQQAAMQQLQEGAVTDVDSFSQDAAHEFFEDVREDMADIMDLATARGQRITLQQAYDRAIMLNPQIAEVVAKRAEAERVNTAAQAAQRARRAAASLSSSPAPAGSPGPGPGADRRSEIEAAWEAQSG